MRALILILSERSMESAFRTYVSDDGISCTFFKIDLDKFGLHVCSADGKSIDTLTNVRINMKMQYAPLEISNDIAEKHVARMGLINLMNEYDFELYGFPTDPREWAAFRLEIFGSEYRKGLAFHYNIVNYIVHYDSRLYVPIYNYSETGTLYSFTEGRLERITDVPLKFILGELKKLPKNIIHALAGITDKLARPVEFGFS